MLTKTIISDISVVSNTGKELFRADTGMLTSDGNSPLSISFPYSGQKEDWDELATIHYTSSQPGGQRSTISNFTVHKKSGHSIFLRSKNIKPQLRASLSNEATPVPGCEVIGWGFNIFGEYNSDSKIRKLINLGKPGEAENFHGKSYVVPSNVSADTSITGTRGSAHTYNSRKEVQDSFASKAKVSGSYGAFSGSFAAKYDQFNSTSSEQMYSIFDFEANLWSLSLKNALSGQLTEEVQNDTDYLNLPATYIPATKKEAGNEILFFRFFDKYGTHFVNKVRMGGQLYAYCSINKKVKMSTQSASANLSAEYNSLFLKSKGKASASWDKVENSWMENAQFECTSKGGTIGILDPVISPGKNTNNHKGYKDWIKSLPETPYAAWFELSSVSKLFSGDRADAIMAAYDAYANSRIYVEAVSTYKERTNPPVMQINGAAQAWPETYYDFQGYKTPAPYWMVVLDSETLLVKESLAFDKKEFEKTIQKKLNKYMDNKHILIFTTYQMINPQIPTGKLFNFLLDCGAGQQLQTMEKHHGETSNDYALDAYCLIGVMGQRINTGLETARDSSNISGGDNNGMVRAEINSALLPRRTADGDQIFVPKWA